MPNHFHLLIRSGPQGLAPFMRKLMTGYATSFNLRHKRSGHLFQNRYKSIICEEDTYLLELVRYIHLNPLRAGIVKDMAALGRHPYCGHGALTGGVGMPWQETQEVWERFSNDRSTARQRYVAFVAEGIALGKRTDLTGGGLVRSMGGIRQVMQARRDGVREAYDSRILGSGEFVESVLKAVEGEQRIQDRLARRGLDIGQLAQRVAGEFGVDAETIFQRNRTAEVSRAKSVFVYLGGEYLRKSNREMALLTQMSDGAATRSRQRGLALLSSTNLKNWLEVN